MIEVWVFVTEKMREGGNEEMAFAIIIAGGVGLFW